MAATLSYYVARQVQESSKLLIPHNDTVDDLLDALGLPPNNLPPFVRILPRYDLPLANSPHYSSIICIRVSSTLLFLKNVTLREIHTKISNNPILHQDLQRRAPLIQSSRLLSISPRVSHPVPSLTRPIARQVNQFTQLSLSITQLDARCTMADA